MSKTKWIGKYGFQFGALDGIQHTSEKKEEDNILRKRRSVILIGKSESNYPVDCAIYIFFCFRLLIDKNKCQQ